MKKDLLSMFQEHIQQIQLFEPEPLSPQNPQISSNLKYDILCQFNLSVLTEAAYLNTSLTNTETIKNNKNLCYNNFPGNPVQSTHSVLRTINPHLRTLTLASEKLF